MNKPWLTFYGDMPHTLQYPDCSMVELVMETAEKHPTLCAYDFMGKRVSFRSFAQEIDRVAASFVAMGIKKGDRVTICLPNIPQGLEAFYALNRIGAIPCMVHPLSAPKEIAYYINLAKSRALITLDIFSSQVIAAQKDVDNPLQVIVAKLEDKLPRVKRWLYPLTGKPNAPTVPGGTSWKRMMKKQAVLPTITTHGNDCAAILYSGGTTGVSKGICLTNQNFNALAYQTIAASGCDTIVGKVMLSVMPIFHGFGLGIGIHTALVGGAKCILIPRFTVDTYAKLVKKEKPDFIPGVPTLFAALLQAKQLQHADLSFLKGVFSGGDSLSTDLKKRVDVFLQSHGATVRIREGYGTTECVTASCLTPISHEKEGSIGIPYPDMLYKIVQPGTDIALSSKQEGEICISGPTVMTGYLDDPIETSKVLQIHSDGHLWLHTGDLGYMDEDGYVYFRQRMKRVIVTNGYNVYPTQIEAVLSEHPKVESCCVIGVKDAMRGQRVRAYLVPNTTVTENELLEHCRNHIAKYALPKEFIIKEELPKTAVGKIAYRLLEEEANHEVETRTNL